MSLEVTVNQKIPGVFVISPAGSIDAGNYVVLKNEVDKVLNISPKAIIFDLADLDFISSAGLGIIFKAKFAIRNKGEFALANLKPQIEAVLETVKALPEQNVFASVEEMDDYLARIQLQKAEGGPLQ